MSAFRGQVPNLVLAQRVIDKMAAAARQHIQDETGEAMIGLLDPGTHTNGVPTLYVLDTIPPDETDVVREVYAFKQGGEHQYEIFTWYLENWAAQRQRLKDGPTSQRRWDLPLRHLGDWHKQPGYMIAPSGGDLMSALDQLHDLADESDDPLGFLLVPIVTVGHPSTTQHGPGVNYLMAPDGDGDLMRVDFWYIDRSVGLFQPITPVVYPDHQLPTLAALPWHLADDARASLEFGQLQHDGWFVSVVLWDADHALPLEICLMLARKGQTTVTIIVTPHDFPASAPKAYRAPFISMRDDDDLYDVFGQMWAQAQPIPDPPGWRWSPDLYLIDYVSALHPATESPAAPTPARPESAGAEQKGSD